MVEKRRRDVCIVGAGISGCCTAYSILSHPDWDPSGGSVTLIEQDDVAAGASGYAGGFIAKDWHGRATASLAALSWDLFNQLADQEPDEGRERYGWRKMNTVGVRAASQTSGQSEASLLLQFRPTRSTTDGLGKVGEQEWLDRIEGDQELLSSHDTTAQVEPAYFTRAMLAAARGLGCLWYKAAPERLSVDDDGRPQSLLLAEQPLLDDERLSFDHLGCESLPCTDLIVAAGPWTPLVARKLQLRNADTLPIGHLAGFSVQLIPKEVIPATAVYANVGSDNDITATPVLFPRVYEITDKLGTVYIGGENGGVELPETAREAHKLVSQERIDKLLESAKRLSSALDGATVSSKALCFRPVTPDSAPCVGELSEGVYICAGAGHWGITLGPGTGHVMAELLLTGGATSADISQLSPKRFF